MMIITPISLQQRIADGGGLDIPLLLLIIDYHSLVLYLLPRVYSILLQRCKRQQHVKSWRSSSLEMRAALEYFVSHSSSSSTFLEKLCDLRDARTSLLSILRMSKVNVGKINRDLIPLYTQGYQQNGGPTFPEDPRLPQHLSRRNRRHTIKSMRLMGPLTMFPPL